MRINVMTGGAAAVVCVGMWGCGSGTIASLSPVSPSSLTTAVAAGSGARIGALDYHEGVPHTPEPDPAPTPPGTEPPPSTEPMPPGAEPMPGVDPAPAPDPALATTRTITIVGTIGTIAFSPNPAEGIPGDMLVWVNSDVRPHYIVLDDGTVIGELLPSAVSAPVPLMTPTATYRCTYHPSMVGTVAALVEAVPPAATEPGAPPAETAPGLPPAGAEPAPPAGTEPAPPSSMPDPYYDGYRRR